MPEDLLDEFAEHEDDLSHSRAMYLYLITKNSHFLNGCNAILADCYRAEEIRTRTKKEAARRVIRLLVIALYKEWEHAPAKYLTISLNNNDWSAGGRYAALRLSARQLSRALHKLHEESYIDFIPGEYRRAAEERRQTQFRALPKLIQTMHLNPRGENVERLIKSDLTRYQSGLTRPRIQLKDEDKVVINPRRTPSHVIESQRLLEQYQALLDRTEIVNPETGEILTPYDKFQYRVFSRGSFKFNGRIHGGFWQRMDSELRESIKLDGEDTIEIDIKATFPVMIYHALGIDYWREFTQNLPENVFKADPYYLEGYTDRETYGKDFRNILKVVFNSAINTTNAGKHLGWLTKLVRERVDALLAGNPPKITPEAADIIKREAPTFIKKFIRERHHLLADYFFNADNGLQAMNYESEVVLKVIAEFVRLNKPILTIFDSFIVKQEDKTLLNETILTSYYHTFGYAPMLD